MMRRTTLIDSLNDAELVDLLDELAGDQRVACLGWAVRERRLVCETFAARNHEIRQRRQKGATLGELAVAYGLSRSRIRDICRKISCVPNAHTHPLARYASIEANRRP
jgi:hypothetical protein